MTAATLFLLFGISLFSLWAHAALPVGIYYRASTEEKVIAFTFDDGPHPQYTDQILHILAKEGVRATFFEIGMNIESYPEITKRVIAAGHEIGNHTYSHPIVCHTTNEQMETEIRKTDRLLAELGYTMPKLFRPPQGICPQNFRNLLKKTEKTAILWNIDTRDWDNRTTAEIVKEVEEHVRGGDIVLFHDYVGCPNSTIAAIKKLIPTLKDRGYQFVTVSELLSFYA